MTLLTAPYPMAPTTTPLKGRLLDVATVVDDIKWLDGRDLFESFNCMNFGAVAEFCAPNTKTFDQGSGFVDGFRFAGYGGLKCRSVGMDMAHTKAEAERVFLANESTPIERGFMETRFAASAGYNPTYPNEGWDAPTDITPTGGAVPYAVGVGMLESHAASIYVGTPTLHLPRLVASLMTTNGALELDGNALHTKLGSKVAGGAGYDLPNLSPTGTEPADDERWLYATGEVLIGRSALISVQELDRSTNDVVMLVERAYIGAVDCYAAAVRVKV